MNTLSDKSYAKFFGEGFREMVEELMPDVVPNEHPLDAHPILKNFLHHLSSPMIHPTHMPGHTRRLYEDAEEPAKPKAPAAPKAPKPKPDKAAAAAAKQAASDQKQKQYADYVKTPEGKTAHSSALATHKAEMARIKGLGKGAGKNDRQKAHKAFSSTPAGQHENQKKLAARQAEIERMQNEGASALAKRGGNPFEHMRRGFHAAFNVDPNTGQQGPDEDENTKQQKLKASKDAFTNFLIKRGKVSPATAAQSNMFGENHKTQTSAGVGYKTIGLSLAPSHHSGYKHDMCPKASTECRENCLGLKAGGNRQFPFATLRSKILRTHFIHEHPEEAARLLHHEIGENEKAAHAIGYKSGIRLNVVSDIPYEHLMPKKFFQSHEDSPEKPGSMFYDYTKMHGRMNHKDMPKNYALALSHTGGNHAESNDKQAVSHLNKGGVVAMVYQRGKGVPHPTHVEDVQSGKRWKIANGDSDDNVFDRHRSVGVPDSEGVVSGLKLKGVSNGSAGHFANNVDPDGIIRINRPQGQTLPGQDQFNILK